MAEMATPQMLANVGRIQCWSTTRRPPPTSTLTTETIT